MVTEKTLSIEEYLNNTKSYLKDIINVSKKLDTWEIHLIITISFFFLKMVMMKNVKYIQKVTTSKS